MAKIEMNRNLVGGFVNGSELNEQYYRGPSIDASYQVLVHLTKLFIKRRYFFKSTNQKQELPVAAMFVNGSVPYEIIKK
jgi:hypothetical protein